MPCQPWMSWTRTLHGTDEHYMAPTNTAWHRRTLSQIATAVLDTNTATDCNRCLDGCRLCNRVCVFILASPVTIAKFWRTALVAMQHVVVPGGMGRGAAWSLVPAKVPGATNKCQGTRRNQQMPNGVRVHLTLKCRASSSVSTVRPHVTISQRKWSY